MNVPALLIMPSLLKWLSLVLVVTCVVNCLALSSATSWAQSDQDYQKSLSEISKEISEVSRNLNANKSLLKTLQDELFESEQALSRAEQALQVTHDKMQEVETLQQDLDKQLVEAQQAQAGNRTVLIELMRSRYREGQANYLKLLLDQENPYAVGRLNNYQKFMSEALQEKAQQVESDIQQVMTLKSRQTELLQQLEIEQKTQLEQEAAFKKAKLERAETVARLNDKVEKSSDKLERLQQDRKRLNSLLSEIKAKALELKRLEEKRLQEKQAQQRSSNESEQTKVQRPIVSGGFAKQKGRLSCPVDAKRSIKYGARVAASGMVSEGILFDTNGSVPVKSIFRGRVLFADFLKGYGLLLIVDHGDDHISLYGHNASLLKNVGDSVETNDVISMSGTTGGLQSPGLYFEIRDNTTPVNPTKWCR